MVSVMKAGIVRLSYIKSQQMRLDPGYYLGDSDLAAQLERSKKALASLEKSVATQEANLTAHRQHVQELEEQGLVIPL